MKRITSVKEIKKAGELRKFMDLRLFAEKKEAELKKHFKDLMGEDEVLYIGDKFVAMLEPRERTGLDTDMLRQALGDQIHDFEVLSSYKVFSLKEASKDKEITFVESKDWSFDKIPLKRRTDK